MFNVAENIMFEGWVKYNNLHLPLEKQLEDSIGQVITSYLLNKISIELTNTLVGLMLNTEDGPYILDKYNVHASFKHNRYNPSDIFVNLSIENKPKQSVVSDANVHVSNGDIGW